MFVRSFFVGYSSSRRFYELVIQHAETYFESRNIAMSLFSISCLLCNAFSYERSTSMIQNIDTDLYVGFVLVTTNNFFQYIKSS